MEHLTLEPISFVPDAAPEGECRIWFGSDGNLYRRVGSQARSQVGSGGSLPTTSEILKGDGAGGAAASGVTAAQITSGLIQADTGWVAPESGGDKAQGLVNYAPPNFGGSDTTDTTQIQDLAAQVVRLTNVVQALQTALVAKLRPNV